ncbi:MAG TPA: response regulator transcription factor [Coriobacteriia bacterium]
MSRLILVADDSPKIVEVLDAYLRAEGFDVVTAADGPSALAAVQARRPDLALLDIMMPSIDGLELTKRLQRDYDLPIILITARVDEIDRLIGLEIGADDYIGKPFSPREVVARVKAVLRRLDRSTGDEPAHILRISGLVVDPGSRSVEIDGAPIVLTRTEFDLLTVMAAHPGHVYSRMQLMEAGQGVAYEGYERTIDAHVKNLRRKLGEDPKEPRYIQTVFGVGYKLEARP